MSALYQYQILGPRELPAPPASTSFTETMDLFQGTGNMSFFCPKDNIFLCVRVLGVRQNVVRLHTYVLSLVFCPDFSLSKWPVDE